MKCFIILFIILLASSIFAITDCEEVLEVFMEWHETHRKIIKDKDEISKYRLIGEIGGGVLLSFLALFFKVKNGNSNGNNKLLNLLYKTINKRGNNPA